MVALDPVCCRHKPVAMAAVVVPKLLRVLLKHWGASCTLLCTHLLKARKVQEHAPLYRLGFAKFAWHLRLAILGQGAT